MKLKMAENSLFAILLRSRWWISIAIAAIIAVLARASLRDEYALYGALAGAPFLVIGVIAASRQLRTPSAALVADTLRSVGTMSWRDFSNLIEEAFRRDGYEVARLSGPQADLAITRSGRTALVCCRRWKAASTGIEPLRELHTAMEGREANESIFVTTGDITDNARRFANERKIRLLQGAELAQLLLRANRKLGDNPNMGA
ncbi:MAG: restriction system protein [Burkholderiales bacterium]